MAIELVCPNLGEASMEEWRRLWNLKVPLKIRHFFVAGLPESSPNKDTFTAKES
jgi:hypothetical protein